jgi:tetratricopeptide (TPR) repeat protein
MIAGSLTVAISATLFLIGAAPEESHPWENNTPERQKAGHDLFEQGVKEFFEQRYEDAERDFRAAIKYDDLPLFHYNLALAALIPLQKLVEAREELLIALKYGQPGLGDEKFKKANAKLKEVEAKLAKLVLTCEQEGAKVTIDDQKALFSCPGKHEKWLLPGSHVIVTYLDKQGYQPQLLRPTLAGGDRPVISLKAPRDEELMVSPLPLPPATAWVAMLGGAAVGGGAFWLRYQAGLQFQQYDDGIALCASQSEPPGSPCPAAAAARLIPPKVRGERLQVAEFIAFGVGGATLVGGGLLLFFNAPRLPAKPEGFAMIPFLAPGSAGVALTAEF